MNTNKERNLAEEFILHTDHNIFLTGKAGTGKTTLLRDILKKTKKKTAVVAPTGVAAINAGGMTIHSMFQLPLTSFIPEHSTLASPDRFTDRKTLVSNHKLRKERRQVFIELELLIIDEISMVRADLLDAIDFTLKRIRKSDEAFGGIQLLVIGDLYQLAPVVKNQDWEVLKNFYASPFFFDSISWKSAIAHKIELQKVYRQNDDKFINILNNIRSGQKMAADIEILNLNYKKKVKEGAITLSTHNRKADAINTAELAKLKNSKYVLKADINGQFSESAYPTAKEIVLKKGAQVMFIRNDPENGYFNGKIGVVKGKEEEKILVVCEDKTLIRVEPIEWKNVRYSVNEETKEIEQEDVGSFKQYPLKLAWAVTVHKSQGLTFDKAILDLENSFAPGQLYVALSRCRTLEGLSLSSRIKLENIIIDRRISQYYDSTALSPDIDKILAKAKIDFEDRQLTKAFNFDKLYGYAEIWEQVILNSNIPSQADVLIFSKDIFKKLNALKGVSEKFSRQLKSLLVQQEFKTDNPNLIIERMQKAIPYFTEEIHKDILLPLQKHLDEYSIKARSKRYCREVDGLVTEFWDKMELFYNLKYRENELFNGTKHKRKVSIFSKKKGKAKKGETYNITLEMFKIGKSPEDIANIRSLAVSTIHGHLSRWIREGEINIFDVMDKARVEKIWKVIKDQLDIPINELKFKLPFETQFYEIRRVREYYETKKAEKK